MEKATRSPGTYAVALLTAGVLVAARGLQAQVSAPASASPVPPAGTSQSQATQTPAGAAALPVFDVVSVKTHKDEGVGMMRIGISVTPDGFQAHGMPLQMLVRQAFGVSEDRILNEPDWVKSARFDIDAKVAPEDARGLEAFSMQERFVMLLPVLEERFGLKFHHEKKELEVYTLVVAKGGQKLKEAKLTDAGKGDQPSPASTGTGAPPPPIPPGAGGTAGSQMAARPGSGSQAPSKGPGMMMSMSSTQGMTLNAHGTPIASLAQMISQQISATVVDKTGLTGNYDFTLSFMPDMAIGTGPMMRPPPDGAQTQDPVGPSIFTALQEQLGLKLVAQKEPMDVIVIDQIEQPTAN
jgi:uncharacterized protein (TIGR03435 family)